MQNVTRGSGIPASSSLSNSATTRLSGLGQHLRSRGDHQFARGLPGDCAGEGLAAPAVPGLLRRIDEGTEGPPPAGVRYRGADSRLAASERPIAELNDARCYDRSAVGIDRVARKPDRGLIDLTHQVAADGVARVGDTVWRSLRAGGEEELRGFDCVRGHDKDATGCVAGAAVGAAEPGPTNLAVWADLERDHEGIGNEPCAGGLRLGGGNAAIPLGTDRTDRLAARAAAAGRSVIEVNSVAELRKDLHRQRERWQYVRHHLIEVGRGDLGHGIARFPRRAPIKRAIARDAGFPLGLAVPWLEIVIGNWPIDADPEQRSGAEIAR